MGGIQRKATAALIGSQIYAAGAAKLLQRPCAKNNWQGMRE